MKRPAFGHLLGYTALTVILTAGAAQSLSGSTTVYTDDIVDGQVYGGDIHDGSVASADIATGGVYGSDIHDGSVAQADLANTAWQNVGPAADGGNCSTQLIFCSSPFLSSHPTWGNYGGAFQAVRFRKYATGEVAIEGLAKAGIDQPRPASIFHLPAGFRPNAEQVFTVACLNDTKDGSGNPTTQSGFGRVDVLSDGSVNPILDANGAPACDPGWISLTGIRFATN